MKENMKARFKEALNSLKNDIKSMIKWIPFTVGLVIFFIVYERYNPVENKDATMDIHECIYKAPHKTIKLNSMGSEFTVNYVENTQKEGINPDFPSIHMTTTGDGNAWIHVVFTDSKGRGNFIRRLFKDLMRDFNPDYKSEDMSNFIFIDFTEGLYPFYTLEKDFYDAPLWRYTFYDKPLRFWKGHAYAIKIDTFQKKIKFLGGVEWGFELSCFKLKPIAITPRAISHEEFQADWVLMKETFEGYELMIN